MEIRSPKVEYTKAVYRSVWTKVERIVGVEPVDTIMEAAFFARAVVDPLVIRGL